MRKKQLEARLAFVDYQRELAVEALEKIKALHCTGGWAGRARCEGCGERWPCQTRREVDAVIR